MTLREARLAFTAAICRLVLWAAEQGYSLSFDEGRVTLRRKVRSSDGKVFFAFDANHMQGSLHYEGLAQDLNLYIGKDYIDSGDHPAWLAISEKWEEMGKELGLPLSAGIRFGDANHLSLAWGGRK